MLEGNYTSHLSHLPSDSTNGWLGVMSIGNVDQGRELCWVAICPPTQPTSPPFSSSLYAVKPTTAPSQRQRRHEMLGSDCHMAHTEQSKAERWDEDEARINLRINPSFILLPPTRILLCHCSRALLSPLTSNMTLRDGGGDVRLACKRVGGVAVYAGGNLACADEARLGSGSRRSISMTSCPALDV